MSDTPHATTRHARRFLCPALSLRAAMLLVLLAALAFGWMTSRARRQARVVAELKKLGADILFDYQLVDGDVLEDAKPPAPAWFRRIVGDDAFREVKRVALPSWDPLKVDKVIEVLGRIGTVDMLVILASPSAEALPKLQSLPGLRSLTIAAWGKGDIPDEALAAIGGMSRLEELTLLGVTDSELIHLRKLRGLRSLELGGPLGDAGLKNLEVLTGLRSLSITTRLRLSANGLHCLAAMHHLEDLTLTSAGWARNRTPIQSDSDLDFLESLTGLRKLDLGFNPIGSAALVHVQKLRELRELSLFGTNVDDAGMKYLSGLTGLRVLNLGGTRVGGEGLKELRACKQLEELSVFETPVNDRGLLCLSVLKSIRRLNMSGTRVTGTGFASLGVMANLEKLDLMGCSIRDADLKYLSVLPKLAKLGLGVTEISDGGLKELGRITGLRELELGSTRVTREGIDRLKAARAGLIVESDFD